MNYKNLTLFFCFVVFSCQVVFGQFGESINFSQNQDIFRYNTKAFNFNNPNEIGLLKWNDETGFNQPSNFNTGLYYTIDENQNLNSGQVLGCDWPLTTKIISYDRDGLGNLGLFYSGNYYDEALFEYIMCTGYTNSTDFFSYTTLENNFVAETMSAGDIDNDGDDDIIAALTTDGYSAGAWYENLGNGDSWLKHESDIPFALLTYYGKNLILDFNGDNITDVVTYETNYTPNGTVSIYFGDGTPFDDINDSINLFKSSELQNYVSSSTTHLQGLDMNQDGRVDIVFTYIKNSTVYCSFLENNGDGTFEPERIIANVPYSSSNSDFDYELNIFDFNDDGINDIVLGHDIIQIFLGHENNEWTFFYEFVDFSAPFHMMDVNNDGALDIVGYNTANDDNFYAWKENQFQDNTPPTAICNENVIIYLDETGNATITPELIDGGSTDDFGITNMELSMYDYDCDDIGATTVKLYVYDAAENSSTCTASIIITDSIAPVLNCSDIETSINFSQVYSIQEYLDSLSITENCGDVTVTASQYDFSPENEGNNAVTIYAEDENGNIDSCIINLNITLIDNIPPTAICNENIVIYLDENGSASITPELIDGGSTDNFGIESLEVNQTDFDCSDLGDFNVELIAFDEEGNSDTCFTDISIVDTLSPTISCTDIDIVITSGETYSIEDDVANFETNDNCSEVTTTISQATFSDADEGANTTTIYIEDGSGNIDSCNITVNVEVVTSILESQYDITVSIAPNPMQNYTVLTFSKSLPFNYDVSIFNINGQNVLQFENLNETNLKIENSNLSNGMYLIKLFKTGTQNVLGTYKLIVK